MRIHAIPEGPGLAFSFSMTTSPAGCESAQAFSGSAPPCPVITCAAREKSALLESNAKRLRKLARPERFERPALRFVPEGLAHKAAWHWKRTLNS